MSVFDFSHILSFYIPGCTKLGKKDLLIINFLGYLRAVD